MVYANRKHSIWRLRTRELALGDRTLIMGIVNATPDSFSDGGAYDPFDHGLRLLDEGADILDLGGESTRPGGAGEVSAKEEQRRVLPVVEALAKRGALISIDTYRASTARMAVEAGAEIVNDVSGMLWDAAMAATCRELRCGVILMHTHGRPAEWAHQVPMQPPIMPQIVGELAERVASSRIDREHIVVDPGFGFGKRGQQNFDMLRDFAQLGDLNLPIMAGASRKGFLGGDTLEQRDEATSRFHSDAVRKGAHILRVHNVKVAVESLNLLKL